jgi:hypothetical protein
MAPFILLACKSADVVPAERLSSVGRTDQGPCAASGHDPPPLPGHRRVPSARYALAHTRQSIQKESRRCGDVEVHTSVLGPLRSCCRCFVLSGSPRPTRSVLVVLSPSKRPPRADAVSAESGEYLPTRTDDRDRRSPAPTRRRSGRAGSAISASSSFDAKLRSAVTATPPTARGDQVMSAAFRPRMPGVSRHAGVFRGSDRGFCVAAQGTDSSRRETSKKRAVRPLTSRPTFDLGVDLYSHSGSTFTLNGKMGENGPGDRVVFQSLEGICCRAGTSPEHALVSGGGALSPDL